MTTTIRKQSFCFYTFLEKATMFARKEIVVIQGKGYK